MLQRM